MKKLSLAIVLLFSATLCFTQIEMLDWPSFPSATKGNLVTNIVTLKEEGIESFDYQGAIFGEYGPVQDFLLFARAIQIDKVDDGSGFLHTCTSYNSGNYESLFVIATKSRVKGLNLYHSALFLCRYKETRTVTSTNKDTGVGREVKVPFFAASQWWSGLKFEDESSLSGSLDSK